MSIVQERYNAVQVGVNATADITSNGLAGFLCLTSGSITISKKSPGTPVILPPLSVVASVYYPLPFYLGHDGGTIVASGGASGVLAVD
jgi:hypothetical protein